MSRQAMDTARGEAMDFSAQLDDLQKRAAEAKASVQAAATESRDKLRQRIDQAQADANLAMKDAQQQAGEAAGRDGSDRRQDGGSGRGRC